MVKVRRSLGFNDVIAPAVSGHQSQALGTSGQPVRLQICIVSRCWRYRNKTD